MILLALAVAPWLNALTGAGHREHGSAGFGPSAGDNKSQPRVDREIWA
jgi:hypothetical protein